MATHDCSHQIDSFSSFALRICQSNARQYDLNAWIDLTRVRYFAGTMVTFWPFAWGLTMAARSVLMPLPDFVLIYVVGFFGACISHRYVTSTPTLQLNPLEGAGCVWNDILDRDIDAKVERTKFRPVASGRISVFGALAFLTLHILCLIAIIWNVNRLAWIIGLITIFPLAGLYPLMKRITYWPQAWLGIAINTGNIMAWACITGTCPSSSWVLSMGTWCWTLWYDTIYACQDKKDDIKAGVKSTALLFGSRVKPNLVFFGSIMIAALLLAGAMNHQGLPFFCVSVFGGFLHMFWQLYSVDVDTPESCWKTFHRNGFYFGAVVEVGLFLDYLSAL